MNLKEFEGKKLLSPYDVNISNGQLVSLYSLKGGLRCEEFPVFVKAQVLSGKRKAGGGVKFCNDLRETSIVVSEMLTSFVNGEKVEEVLIDSCVDFEKEYYVSIFVDSRSRRPILIVSSDGGSDIEDIKKRNPTSIRTMEISIIKGIDSSQLFALVMDFNFSDLEFSNFRKCVLELYKCFIDNDLKLLEINPLVLTSDFEFVCLDCKAIIDDNSLYRHNFEFSERTGLRGKTVLEARANEIDREDYRGVAGTSYIDFGGDIGVLASGGGASVIAMDALISYGGKPANYTEYSGNPPSEKVAKLTNVVLDQPNLKGLWIVGGTANFTSIYDTLKALIDVVVERKFKGPIVIRRAGPEDEKAFEMIREVADKEGLDISLYGRETPITLSAKYIVDKVNECSYEFNLGDELEDIIEGDLK